MRKAKTTIVKDEFDLLPGTCVLLAANLLLEAPPEFRSRYMGAIGELSQVPNIRQSLVERGQLADIDVMPFNEAEAKANPEKKGWAIGGLTRLALAAQDGREVSCKVHPRKEWPEVLKDAFTRNYRADSLTAMDMSHVINRLLALGEERDAIEVLMAPPGKKRLSKIRFQQYRDLMKMDDEFKLLVAGRVITEDLALNMTNKTPGQIKAQIERVKNHRVLQLRAEAIEDRKWLDRVTDAGLKKELSDTMLNMPEIDALVAEQKEKAKRRRVKKVDDPITKADATEANEAEKVANGTATGPLSAEELAAAHQSLRERGGAMIEVATILEGHRQRRISNEEFCDVMTALFTNGGDEAGHIRHTIAKKLKVEPPPTPPAKANRKPRREPAMIPA